jgi:PKD repeat protein
MSRGQALVEFALILPILTILLMMALDLGRVYFGWVGLQNAARIGANYAAVHPTAWSNDQGLIGQPLKQDARAQYAQQIAQDAEALNCTPRPNASNVPVPVFTSITATSNPHELGDLASVTLHCTFQLLTPLASTFFPAGVSVSANAVFPVRGGAIVPNIPSPAPIVQPPPPPPAPCKAPIANFSATPTSGKKPLTVTFTDVSIPQGCQVTSWNWDFGDGSVHSFVQNPPAHQYTKQGTYAVRLTVGSAAGSDSLRQNGYIKVSN